MNNRGTKSQTHIFVFSKDAVSRCDSGNFARARFSYGDDSKRT